MFNPPYAPGTAIPYLELLLSLVKSLLWPALITFALWYFNKDLRAFLARVIELNTKGITAAPPPQVSVDTKDIAKGNTTPLATNENTEPVFRDVLQGVESWLNTISKDDRETALIRKLAEERMEKVFAIVYSEIFGSQINALSIIVNHRNGTVSWADAEEWFGELKKSIPALQSWTLAQYLNYLMAARFIEVKDGMIHTTPAAGNFLIFLQRYNLPHNRLN